MSDHPAVATCSLCGVKRGIAVWLGFEAVCHWCRASAQRPQRLVRIALALWLGSVSVSAQEPVQTGADVASWATATANPIRATWQMLGSKNQTCEAVRLGMSAAIINGTVLLLKHIIHSPRPCLGCAPDGMPSGHEAQSWIGAGVPWGPNRGLSFSVNVGLTAATGLLRMKANRHTGRQVAAGAAIGFGGELGARLLVRCE